MRSLLLCLLLLLAVAGCQTKDKMLAGSWKAKPVASTSSPNLSEAMQKAQMSMWTQNLQFEFNDEGTFKVTNMIGQGTGSFKWEGDVLVLTFNTLAPQVPLKLRFGEGGKTLEEVTEFESDVKLVLEKAQS